MEVLNKKKHQVIFEKIINLTDKTAFDDKIIKSEHNLSDEDKLDCCIYPKKTKKGEITNRRK